LGRLLRFDLGEPLPDAAVAPLPLMSPSSEAALWAVGIDEAGRGALAGPLVVGCVSFGPLSREPTEHDAWLEEFRGLDDSKRVPSERREALYRLVIDRGAWSVGWAQPQEVDAWGVTRAASAAVCRALRRMSATPSLALLDYGLAVPPGDRAADRVKQAAILHGDQRSLHIAAASIVAKVVRDRMMVVMSQRHVGYGFDHNMGYATPMHLDALRSLGPCPIHRRSFRGVIPGGAADAD
jgi:ribonuclease HII